ncbi:MAG: biopolymer transporter Tol [Verrucomicrobiota bacterium]
MHHLLRRSPLAACLVVACALVLPLPSAYAQVNVRASAVPSVGLSIGGPVGGGATEIVAADLRRTSEMVPVPGGTGDYVATGSAGEAGITGQLVNKRTGATLFNETFSGRGRLSAHQFADAITKAVTGLPGFATSKIAFISNMSGAKELYEADIDGYNVRAITHDGTISASPALSHDASKIAYTSYKSGYADVYLIDLASGSRARIAFYPGINTGPSFSPDGSTIALTLSKDGNPEIYTISLGGSIVNRITRTRGAETSPSWSPTGDQLVYSSDDRGSPQLFISSSSGVSEMDHLVTGNSYCTKPDWSPDGRLIAFTTRIGGQFQIGVYDVASRNGTLVTADGGEDPAWTRDSRHLVYSNHGRLLVSIPPRANRCRSR